MFGNYVVIIALLPWCCKSFLVDQPACHSKCVCSNNKIDCTNKRLKTFPRLAAGFPTQYKVLITFNNNSLTTIPNNAFMDLRVSNDVVLHFENNDIQGIQNDAFTGIEARIVQIDLNNNSLTTIPPALTKLPNLLILNVLLNPISSFRSSSATLKAIGGNLKMFYVDLQLFSSWAFEIDLLHSLEFLYIINYRGTNIHENALYGLKDSLTMLTIRHTQLVKIPTAICDLYRLDHLTFAYNTNLDTRGSMFDPCPKNDSRVWLLDLYYNDLIPSNIQNLFQAFPHLVVLSISGNPRLDDIQIHTTNDIVLRNLLLKQNGFTEIPTSLSKLKELRTLEITFSEITTIRAHDLNKLVKLRKLVLHDNPIDYISADAFRNNLMLERLELQNTHLRTIPSSLITIPNLGHVILNEDILCSCRLKYLQSWDIGRIDILGECDSHRKITDFLKYDLPNCR